MDITDLTDLLDLMFPDNLLDISSVPESIKTSCMKRFTLKSEVCFWLFD